MSQVLTPDRMASIYEMLRSLPPYNRWSLPSKDQVRFKVIRNRTKQADYEPPPKETIRVSVNSTSHLFTIMQAIAHEMVHQRLRHAGSKNWASHGAEFQRLASRVCRVYGWDERQF